MVVALELQEGVRGKDGGAFTGRRGRGRPGLLDAERLVRVPRHADGRPASAPRPAGHRGDVRRERGRSRPRRRQQVGIPVLRVRPVAGKPGVVSDHTGDGGGRTGLGTRFRETDRQCRWTAGGQGGCKTWGM